jgi:hypothetical protein
MLNRFVVDGETVDSLELKVQSIVLCSKSESEYLLLIAESAANLKNALLSTIS